MHLPVPASRQCEMSTELIAEATAVISLFIIRAIILVLLTVSLGTLLSRWDA